MYLQAIAYLAILIALFVDLSLLTWIHRMDVRTLLGVTLLLFVLIEPMAGLLLGIAIIVLLVRMHTYELRYMSQPALRANPIENNLQEFHQYVTPEHLEAAQNNRVGAWEENKDGPVAYMPSEIISLVEDPVQHTS